MVLPEAATGQPAGSRFRRFAIGLIACVATPPLALAAAIVLVDPYYVFGTPDIPGINVVRPRYENLLPAAKPYQVRRIRPDAVILGSSRAETGLDPRHPGWAGNNVFNFGLPGATSYEVMLAFLHAQASAPLKQAVVGLDFFGFNILFPRDPEYLEARFSGDGVRAFADFLSAELAKRRSEVSGGAEGGPDGTAPHDWNEELYLRVNPDVKDAIARGTFVSGYHHWLAAGKLERREGGLAPSDWYEARYLQANPDVAYKIRAGRYLNGYHHYLAAGRAENRSGRFRPEGWNEAEYLTRNAIARVRLALGDYRDGYAHYAAAGQKQQLPGGFPPADSTDTLWQSWPQLGKAVFRTGEFFGLIFSRTALRDTFLTLRGQSEPASFDDRGTRRWGSHDDVLRKIGGTGLVIRSTLQSFQWYLWLMPPRYMYCLSHPDTGMTSFDAFRFMVRQAHANGTDLRLFITPALPSVRHLFSALGLSGRYEFWQKELVRINEEEAARAGRKPLPLWDFSDANTITSEVVPAAADLTPMHWYWEFSHYRIRTGDLILDRIFGYRSPGRIMPADFGVRLTGDNIDAHLAHSRAGIADWTTGNPEFATQISAATKAANVQNRQAEATCW